MRIEALATSIPLLTALIPSLLPAWRNALIAAGCFYGLSAVAFMLVLRQFGATNEEGPAFMGLTFLYGFATLFLLASFAARLIVYLALTKTSQYTASLLRRLLIGSGFLFAVLALLGALEFSLHRGFAIMVGSASIWLIMVTRLMPNNSSKPTPLRGAA